MSALQETVREARPEGTHAPVDEKLEVMATRGAVYSVDSFRIFHVDDQLFDLRRSVEGELGEGGVFPQGSKELIF